MKPEINYSKAIEFAKAYHLFGSFDPIRIREENIR
jgi:hypothetical protein